MNVIALIQEKKRQFKQNRYVMERARLEQQNEELKIEQARARAVAEARQAGEELRRDINAHRPKEPNTVQKFGNGLAKVMNKGKTDFADAKKQGYFKGINHQVQTTKKDQYNRSPGGINFGGGSGLNFGSKPPEIQSKKPKKVVTKYY